MANFVLSKPWFPYLLAPLPLVAGALLLGPPAKGAPAANAAVADSAALFNKEVKPILQENCIACHRGTEPMGGLRLTSRAAILKGGASGPAVVLAKPNESLLLAAVNHQGRQMPPQGKMAPKKIEALTRWVNRGLPWPEGPEGNVEAEEQHAGPPKVTPETMKFWSFQPVKRPAVPKVKNGAWVKSPIDAFVMAKLEKNSLTPAPPASKTALIRRVYFDLIGLPPPPEAVAAFVADTSPGAYEKVVDRLLASPQYGERWARHWLDVVRYAESNSFERDDPKPFAWRYRDYVIHSLNTDKPYDLFVREQLAGDELDRVTPETIIATGFYRLGQWDDEPADPLQARYDELDDVVATTSQAFLGMTVNCARCHDHKIDPIPQKDYYRLMAFFQNTTRYGLRSPESVAKNSLRVIAPKEEQERFAAESAVYKGKLDGVNAQLKVIEDVVTPDFAPVEKEDFKYDQNRVALLRKRVPALLSEEKFGHYAQLMKERDTLLKSPPRGLAQALSIKENGTEAPRTFLLMRGNPHAPGDEVEPGFPSVLAPPRPKIRPAASGESTGRRRALADWIASPANPLTARVQVNRIWQRHFGRGIVRSSNNFGFQGTPPTHPELLDWLASEFVKNNWKMKPLHKMILLSSTYRMSSRGNPKALAKDPENDLLWRFDMRRLDAEEIRDSILAVNGSLNTALGGPPIYPAIPPEVLAGQSRPGHGWPTSPPEQQTRRSVYVHVKRSLSLPILASFDAADTDASCPVRFATTQPTQALSMLNSTFVNEQARIFADYLRKHAGNDPVAQVKLALRRTLQRAPTQPEISRGVKMMRSLQNEHKVAKEDALRYFCIVALNLNEFIYLD